MQKSAAQMLIFELKSFNGCTYNYLTKYIKKNMWFEFEKKIIYALKPADI